MKNKNEIKTKLMKLEMFHNSILQHTAVRFFLDSIVISQVVFRDILEVS